jgi:NHLM bacteriocin system ABC transporter peptidase/ATP-binding protein
MARVNRKGVIRPGVARVPVIMQMEELECGAACLAMVLAYYGKWVAQERVRADCGVSRNGANAKNIVLAARRYGLDAKGFRLGFDELRENGVFPCVVHWNFNHFVVLCGFRRGTAVINDPSKGTLRVPLKRFARSYSGVYLTFAPGERFRPEGRRRSVAGFALSRIKAVKAAAAFAAFAAALTALFGIIQPLFSRFFVDYLLPGRAGGLLTPFALALFALAFLRSIAEFTKNGYMLKTEGKLAASGGAAFFWHVLRLPLDFFSQRSIGDITMRQASNETVASHMLRLLAPLAIDFAAAVFYLTVMLRSSVPLSLLGLSAMGLSLLLSLYASRVRLNLIRARARDAQILAAASSAGFEMIETLKAAGAERGYFERWTGYQSAVNASGAKTARVSALFGAVPALLSALVTGGTFVLGGALIAGGHMTAGMVLAFQGFLSAFVRPAQSLISAGQTLSETRSAMERIEDVFRYAPDTPADLCPPKAQSGKLSGAFELRGLSFAYSPLSPPVVEDINISVPQGAFVALVGGSGSGKSTLANLITGLYRPQSGDILFDGAPAASIDRMTFAGSVAVVSQDVTLFADTAADNIKMWDASIEDYDIILAAKDAAIHDDIMRRDGGYERRLADGGKDLSGGQRQRLEIARALASDPSLLIMDEATSALDAKTEHAVMKAVRDRGITCVVIAHRLSAVRDCDEIIVLDKGRVAERGTHGALTAAGGLYARLVMEG